MTITFDGILLSTKHLYIFSNLRKLAYVKIVCFMSKQIKLNQEGYERHLCESQRHGDWILFTCPNCDFVREINYKTGTMNTTGGEVNVMHDGTHLPTGIDPGQMAALGN